MQPTRVGKAGLAAPGEHVPGSGRGRRSGGSPGLGGVERLPGERPRLLVGRGVLFVDRGTTSSSSIGAADAAIMVTGEI